ncbi:MAG TPA: hypothetical protein VLH40_01195 [Atribacteraceae bacterium]|nr:hypothetical protein [Atribacteraceae bacterium]
MNRFMRLASVVSILLLLLVLFLAYPASAHPPSTINLAFDTGTKILLVNILHSVGDPADHYIEEVYVFLNGATIIEQKMLSQFSAGEQVVQYLIIDAEPGDTLEVWAECSRFGDLASRLVIE